MLLRSASVQPIFETSDADKTAPQPRLPAENADATGELSAEDIVEVEITDLRAAVDLRRPRIKSVRPPSFERASRVFVDAPVSTESPEAEPMRKLPVPLPPPTRRRLPQQQQQPQQPQQPPNQQPGLPLPRVPAPPRLPSLVPSAWGPVTLQPLELQPLELTPSAWGPVTLQPLELTPSSLSFDSMADLERAAGIPRRPLWQTGLMVGASVMLVALSLVSAVTLRSSWPRRGRVAATLRAPNIVVATPRTPSVVAAHEAVIVPVLTATAKDSTEIDEEVSPTLAPRARPPHRSSMATATTATSSSEPMGLLRLSPSLKGVLVDGAPHRVDRGLVSVPCGTHRIKTSSQPVRVVVVACNGTTVL